MFDPTQVGVRVSRLREALGLTHKELADACENGLSTVALRSLESGRKSDLTVNQLVALAFFLGATPAELLLGSSDFTDDIVVVAGSHPVRAQRGAAIAWFSGFRSAKALSFKKAEARLVPPDQSRTPEMLRILERQQFLSAEIERHKKLEKFQPGPINSIMIRALESELAENNHFLSLVGAVPAPPRKSPRTTE